MIMYCMYCVRYSNVFSLFFFEQVLFVVLTNSSILQESGVFKGWNKDKFFFSPTNKYAWNSDNYDDDDAASKSQRRSKMHQKCKLSDHTYIV
jgi:hypothetical protein